MKLNLCVPLRPVCVTLVHLLMFTYNSHSTCPLITLPLSDSDYKGHVLLACSDSCLIAYHSSCWRRFKSESVISSDRDFLLTPCPTPDCSGDVKTVTVYDLMGKCKIRVSPSPGIC